MSAKVLEFCKPGMGFRATCAEIARSETPMSQVLPLPRVDVAGHHPLGHPDLIVFDVEYVRHDGPDGFDVLATFRDPDEAEAFADRWMAANPEMGGGQ